MPSLLHCAGDLHERTCVWMGLKCEKRYWASYSGQSRADRGSGSRSSSSVWGGWRSGRMRPLKDMGSVVSACSQVSDTALRACSSSSIRPPGKT